MADNVQGVKVPIGVTVDPAATRKLDEIMDAAERRTKRVIQGVHDVDAGASNSTKNALDRNLKAIQHHYDDINNIIEQNGTKLSARVLARADRVTATIANSVNESQRALQNVVTGGAGAGGGGFGFGRQLLGAGLAIVGARSIASSISETINKTEEYAKIASILGQRSGNYSAMWEAGKGGRGWFNPFENLNLEGRMAGAAGTTNVGIQTGLVRRAETITGALSLGDKGETMADLTEALRMAGAKPEKIEKWLEQIAKSTGVAGDLAKTNPAAYAAALVPFLQAYSRIGTMSSTSLNTMLSNTASAWQGGPATAENYAQYATSATANAPNLAVNPPPEILWAYTQALRKVKPNISMFEIRNQISRGSPVVRAAAFAEYQALYGRQDDPEFMANLAMDWTRKTSGLSLGPEMATNVVAVDAGKTLPGIVPGKESDLTALGKKLEDTPEANRLRSDRARILQEIEVGKHITPATQFFNRFPFLQGTLETMGGALTALGAWKIGAAALRPAVPLAARLAAPVAMAVGGPEILTAAAAAASIYGAYKVGEATSSWGGNLLYQANRLFNPFSTDYESQLYADSMIGPKGRDGGVPPERPKGRDGNFLSDTFYNIGRNVWQDYEGPRYAESMIGPKGYGGGVSKDRFEAFMAALASNETGGVDPKKRYGKRGDQIIPGTAGERALGKYQMRLGTARQYSGKQDLTEDEFLNNPDLQETASRNYVRYLLSKHHGDLDASAKEWGGFRHADPTAYLDKLHASMGSEPADTRYASMGMEPAAPQHIMVDLTPDAQKLLRIVSTQGRVPETRLP